MSIAPRAAAAVAAHGAGPVAKIDPQRTPVKGPSFGRYRDEPPKPGQTDVVNDSIGKSVAGATAGKRSPARSL
jgi:hypothetical protein